MSIKSKIAAIAAASLGMVLTQSSAPRAEIENSSAPEKLTKIAAPIDVNDEIFYSAVPDDALERAAASTPFSAQSACCGVLSNDCTGSSSCNTQVKKLPSGGLKRGPTTVPPKPIQQNKNK
jgi:hypothetical protein